MPDKNSAKTGLLTLDALVTLCEVRFWDDEAAVTVRAEDSKVKASTQSEHKSGVAT